MFMITLHALCNRLSWKRNALSNVVLRTKNGNGSAVKSLYSLLKPLKSISDEELVAICWSYCLFKIFMMKKCLLFSLISFDPWNYDWVMKTKKIFNFLSLINSSVTTEWRFLLLIVLAIISSNTINVVASIVGCVLQYCYGIIQMIWVFY